MTTLPPNRLSAFLRFHQIKEPDAMAVLLDAGVISDLCMKPEQVAKADEWEAINTLRKVFRK